MFLNKIRNNFCVPDTKFVSATNVARAGKRENICVGNNVSSFASSFRPRVRIKIWNRAGQKVDLLFSGLKLAHLAVH